MKTTRGCHQCQGSDLVFCSQGMWPDYHPLDYLYNAITSNCSRRDSSDSRILTIYGFLISVLCRCFFPLNLYFKERKSGQRSILRKLGQDHDLVLCHRFAEYVFCIATSVWGNLELTMVCGIFEVMFLVGADFINDSNRFFYILCNISKNVNSL